MWIKLDDSYFTHRKIVQLTGPAILMDITGIAFCARELTDGFVADGAVLLVSALAKISEPEKHLGELVRVGRWEKRDGGYMIHDYLEYQPTKERVLELREIRSAVGRQGGKASGEARSKLLDNRSKNRSKTEAKPEAKSNPESRIPNPESRALFPVPADPTGNGLPTAPRKKPRGNGSVTAPTWDAYRESYVNTYHVEPVRNAKVNGQISQIVQRLGAADAPKVAAWFLTHRGAWYVQQGHCVGALLRDCEKLHTEWLNGATLHRRDVDEIDRTSADQAMWKRIEDRHEARKVGQE